MLYVKYISIQVFKNMFLNCSCQYTIKLCLNALLIPMTAEAISSVAHWPIEEPLYFVYICTYIIHVREEMSHTQDFEIHWINAIL